MLRIITDVNHMGDIVDNCPFTVLAPTDDAFAKLAAGTVDALLQDMPKLTKILTKTSIFQFGK